jgi:hypothetical protein
MSDASIPLSETTRDRLREAKGGETYDEHIRRLLASHDGRAAESSCECDPDAIAERVEQRVVDRLLTELR